MERGAIFGTFKKKQTAQNITITSHHKIQDL